MRRQQLISQETTPSKFSFKPSTFVLPPPKNITKQGNFFNPSFSSSFHSLIHIVVIDDAFVVADDVVIRVTGNASPLLDDTASGVVSLPPCAACAYANGVAAKGPPCGIIDDDVSLQSTSDSVASLHCVFSP